MDYLRRYYKYILGFTFVTIIVIVLVYLNIKTITSNIKIDNKEKKEEIIEVKKEDVKEDENNDIIYYYVDIKGLVNNPGVYKVEEGKRVIDVINEAGGLKDKADTSILNLSKKITDEMCIIVYSKDEIKEYKDKNLTIDEINSEIKKQNTIDDNFNDAKIDYENTKNKENISSKVSINTASKEELMTISGIGESKANAIIKYREENGNFESIEDIMNVSGIGDALYEKIKDNITI